jgi:superfamily II DNA or RNA helicase
MTAEFGAGTLVKARGREWVVLPQSRQPGFLVLRPLGGDDQEIAAVFPHLEDVRPATFDPPDPDDAGNASSAGLLRTALRIGFRSTGGPFRSLGSIAVEPRAYQLVPLLMALRQEKVRLLISDDVGIGKTIEAGLIAAELLEQGEANGLVVLCSPALAQQWQGELAAKFGIQAELLVPGTIHRLQRGLLDSETVFSRYRHLVVSTDFIKRPGLREMFWRDCPDLVIVDEAHTCVGDSGAARARIYRHELLRRLSADPRRHLLLVTATPHSGKDEGFRELLTLLSPSLADINLDVQADRERLARFFVQRRRADIREFLDETTPFPQDRLRQERPYQLSEEYRALFDDVLAYARQTVRDESGGQVRQRVRYWSALALLRALASSPRAAAATLVTRAGPAEATDVDEADALGRAAVLDLPDDEAVESADITPGADDETGDETTTTPHRRKLLAFARRARGLEGGKDRKLAEITDVVRDLLASGCNPVVFCRFIDTAEYVAEHLRQALGDITTVDAVTGALHPQEREARIKELSARDRPVLVCTDCLSEGINLQQAFQAVVHYDLAWNPTRHEQREGRVDRFGQTAKHVRAVTLYGTDNRIDGIVLDVLLRKHEEIRRALGISVPVPDRSDEVVEAILEGLLLREQPSDQLMLPGIGEEVRSLLHREWESSAERERRSRTRYAQSAIRPQEVAREVAELRASLGTGTETGWFTREALTALGADILHVTDGAAFDARTWSLPRGLADALPAGHAEPLPFNDKLPVPARHAHLDRTDPSVAAIARFVLESALDPTLPASQRPARRAGVMRTEAVSRRTTLLLVRFRLNVELPGRELVAEEARILAYRGRAAGPDWLTEDESAALLTAAPSGNIPPDQAADFLEQAVVVGPGLLDHLGDTGDLLAVALRDAHIRVREAGGQRVRRQITVTAQRPPDVLGVYVYLPGAGR